MVLMLFFRQKIGINALGESCEGNSGKEDKKTYVAGKISLKLIPLFFGFGRFQNYSLQIQSIGLHLPI